MSGLPRVVPLQAPSKEPENTAKKPAAAPAPAVDLLAPPPLPSGWWTQAIRREVPVAPIVHSIPPAAPAAAPKPHPALSPSLPPPTAKVAPARTWPAAFLVRSESEPEAPRQAANFEKSDDPKTPESEGKPPAVAEVQRSVEAVPGREVTGVSVQKQPDGCIVVRIRVRNRGADPDKGKVVELPQAAGSGVRVLLEVER
jgi:hypothetical protein